MRGMDKSETHQLILEGFILNYNYLRPHESLKDRTPAEVAKVDFPYKSWLDVIKSQIPKPPPKPDRKLTLEEMRHPFKALQEKTKAKEKRNPTNTTQGRSLCWAWDDEQTLLQRGKKKEVTLMLYVIGLLALSLLITASIIIVFLFLASEICILAGNIT